MSSEPIYVYVALDLPSAPKALAIHARAVISHFTGNDLFPNPSPTLAVCSQNVDALDTAMTAAATRARGAIKARKAAMKRVKADLRKLANYVQGVLETLPPGTDPEQAVSSAFMRLRRRSKRNQPALAVGPGQLSGSVWIVARRVAKAIAYYWEYSSDQTTWIAVPETAQLSTEITGLTPGEVYHFRFRTLGRKGKSDPSQVVSLRVV
jgi:hypothetical protein